nr:MAG TPA: hypothetical protein [Caudoviricetes sp.]
MPTNTLTRYIFLSTQIATTVCFWLSYLSHGSKSAHPEHAI